MDTYAPTATAPAAANKASLTADERRATSSLRRHPQAALVPPMPADHYQAFRSDIARRGVLTPLEITANGVVLDGRERLRAASELQIETVPIRIIAPTDEVEYILLCALQRRQLTASQKAALALELQRYQELKADAAQRRLQNLCQTSTEVAILPPRGKTREIAASWAGVSPRTLQDAATVQAHDPALFEQIKQGQIAADQAARRIRRRLRDDQITGPPPLPSGRFEIVYADPPWQLGNPDGPNAPERHYPTLPLEEIKALPVPAADDCLLLIWAVNCLLPEALQVIDAWGFSYKTELVWVKPSIGLGNWTRNQHEPLLLATKGCFPLAEPDRRFSSVIHAPRRRHSQKPEIVYQLIEQAWPHASKLELFARTPPPGWTAWGNQLQAA